MKIEVGKEYYCSYKNEKGVLVMKDEGWIVRENTPETLIMEKTGESNRIGDYKKGKKIKWEKGVNECSLGVYGIFRIFSDERLSSIHVFTPKN